jgi:leucyl aminopeptidase (aminopeptidase T)
MAGPNLLEPIAAELQRAAGVLVRTGLRVGPGERCVIVADEGSGDIGEALERAVVAEGGHATLARLDELRSVATGHSGERPHRVLPDTLRRAMLAAQASVFVASAPQKELSMREQLLHIVAACGVRHAHLPGIARLSFVRGLVADHERIARAGSATLRKLGHARFLEAESAAGTKLFVRLGDEPRWVANLGDVQPGTAVTFPSGALYASPASVRGTFVANASLGEFFGAREGLLSAHPVRFVFVDGCVVRVEAPHSAELQREIESMLALAPNSNRVGLVVLGVNPGLSAPTGDAAVDQNLPGLHLVLGDPGGRVSGVGWSARTSFVACSAEATVVANGATLIDHGRLSASDAEGPPGSESSKM